MKNFLILIFLFFWLTPYGFADQGIYRSSFKSNNGKYEFRIIDQKSEKRKDESGWEYEIVLETTWGLFNSQTNKQLYNFKGDFTSKTALISNNGKYIIVVDDYSEASPTDSLVVLEFFTEGKPTISYSLGQLLCSAKNISTSASHFKWFSDSDFLAHKDQWSFHSFEFRKLNFDIKTGKLIRSELDPVINKSSILVYGEVRKTADNQYELDVCHRVYGVIPEDGKIKFFSKINLHNAYQTILINDSELVYSKLKTIYKWMLNSCAYQYGSTENKNNNPIDTCF
ncbi:hypothetical protein I5M27_15710 [Adhaeribacter sp. BT258]|uniref:Uncharacterized protein n=1 Tax=Adhaeribacter terrigena TaxID=2793070 RepID=A0ABS1C508_9BACT|nr:hypothetical protein [Adhaeribacter terrigena]MBK0404445.1 hypothetical protein [Adhaeribacter terrigena]